MGEYSIVGIPAFVAFRGSAKEHSRLVKADEERLNEFLAAAFN
jgi:hypothetical protein